MNWTGKGKHVNPRVQYTCALHVFFLVKHGTTSELPLIGITNFLNYHSLMLVIAMLVILMFLIGISTF